MKSQDIQNTVPDSSGAEEPIEDHQPELERTLTSQETAEWREETDRIDFVRPPQYTLQTPPCCETEQPAAIKKGQSKSNPSRDEGKSKGKRRQTKTESRPLPLLIKLAEDVRQILKPFMARGALRPLDPTTAINVYLRREAFGEFLRRNFGNELDLDVSKKNE